MKSKRAIFIALGMGVFALIAHKMYIDKRIEIEIGPYERLPVIVATQDIDFNTRISESMLRVEMMPKKFIQPGTLSKVEDAIGYLSAVTIRKEEQLLKNKLVEYDKTFLAMRIPEGMRAVTIAVNDVSGVAGLLKPGNYIDILVLYNYSRPDPKDRTGQTQVLDKRITTPFQKVLLLAVGREYKFITNPLALDQSIKSTPRAVRNITVALPPRQCQRLVLAQEVGLLYTTLRPHFDDPQIRNIPQDDIYSVTGTKEPLRPAQKAPYLELRGANIGEGF